MREPAADLAIALAIVSGHYSIPVPRDMVVMGEVSRTRGTVWVLVLLAPLPLLGRLAWGWRRAAHQVLGSGDQR